MKQPSNSQKHPGIWFLCLTLVIFPMGRICAATSDPLLDLFIKKGFVTEQEAAKIKVEADALREGSTNSLPPLPESKWKIGKAIKNVELFGDIRLRYEQREARTPGDQKLELDRGRY